MTIENNMWREYEGYRWIIVGQDVLPVLAG